MPSGAKAKNALCLPLLSVLLAGCGIRQLSSLAPIPDPPAKFTATANSATQIDLTWQDTSNGTAGFVLQRSTDGTTFSTVATPSSGTLLFRDTGLSAGVTYSYRIQAQRSGQGSGFAQASSTVASGGTWTKLTRLTPSFIDLMFLLSNGNVMAHGNGATWYVLTPDSSGSYVNGTWSNLAPMGLQREYFSSMLLPNGNLFVIGGEYSGPSLTQNLTNTSELYDPVANTWTATPTMPVASFGDDPAETLPNGTVLAASLSTAQTSIYDPIANSWAAGPSKLFNDRSDEETWVKLPDGSILSYDIFGNAGEAQRYVPSINQWVDSGAPPLPLHDSTSELGPAMLLPTGNVFFIGASGHTGLYAPPSVATDPGKWTAGPDIPGNMGGVDTPASEMPNGHVLFAVGPVASFSSPTKLYDYDPTANALTEVKGDPSMYLQNLSPALSTMLLLPTGQILYQIGSFQLWVYTPGGAADPPWAPAVSSIAKNGDGSYTLTGTQLTGLSEGCNYGDDFQNATNYPLVRLTDSGGVVRYARTYKWSSTGVATGATPGTVQFTLPAGVTAGSGTYTLEVVANGIASAKQSFQP